MIIFIIIIIIFIILFYFLFISSEKTRKKVVCDSDAIKYSPAQYEGPPQKIPYIIIQTNKDDKVTSSMKTAMMKIIKMNPEYEYKYFNNDDCRNYLQENFGDHHVQLFDSLVPGAFKADFFRICYLNKNGGVYIDSSFDAISPLRELIEQDDEFIGPHDMADGIYNAFMCSVPGHIISEENIKLLVYNISNKLYTGNPLGVTGPGSLGKVYKKLYGKIKIGIQNSVKIIKHTLDIFSENGGTISWKNKIFFNTRYKGYDKEFRKGGVYHTIWLNRKIYK